jgi:glucosamine--fructose-6-phosphate aminotransferase (isomerizing)
VPVTPKVKQLEIELEEIELGGYAHFMQKEIFEQPKACATLPRAHRHREGKVVLGGSQPSPRN